MRPLPSSPTLNSTAISADPPVGSGVGSGLAGAAIATTSNGVKAASRIAARAAEPTTGHRWVVVALLGDFLLAIAGSLLAYHLRFNTALQEIGLHQDLTMRQYFGHMALGSVSLVMVLGWQGLYQRSTLLRPRWQADRILKSVALWTLGFLSVTLALKLEPAISRMYTALNGVCVFVLIELWRAGLTRALRNPKSLDLLRQRVLFVGWSADAEKLAKSFNADPYSAVEVAGVVTGSEIDPETVQGSPDRLGSTEELESVLEQHQIDMVIVADLFDPREDLMHLSAICERELVQFKVIPSCFRIFLSGLHLETIAGTPILGVDKMPLDRTFNHVVKRMTDIVGGIVGLVLSAPIIALFGALVWLESRGSIFYRQRRSGMIGRPFDIFKIRSMKLDAESKGGAQWATEDDPRRLKVGAFMRKWNIDELPQFWNVLRGEMSLVGPRPERPELIQNFKHEIPHYNARHHAKPGMTGWAQIKGLRGDTDLEERIKCDLWYMENWSWVLDLQIMFMTFFKRDNAY